MKVEMIPIFKVAEIIMGQSPNGDTYNHIGDGLPLLNGPTEFGHYKPECTMYTIDSKRESQQGDLLFCVRGSTTGRMNWADQVYSLGRGVCAIRGESQLITKYIKYCLDAYLDGLLQLAGGGTFPNLCRSDIGAFKIPYSDKVEEIASILSAYDDLIENNLKRIRLLEEAAEIIYQREFGFFKPNYNINHLPDGWSIKRADEIFRINIGKTPPREQSEWFNDSDSFVRWVSIKDINNSSVFIIDTSETLTEAAINKFNMNVASIGSVLLSFKLTVGKVAITTEKMVTNEAIAHFNIDDANLMNTEFIYFYLKSFPYNTLGSTSSIGVAINSKIVKAMPILLPVSSKMIEFGKNVGPFFIQILNLLKQNTKLREARDILLPRLMSGEIEV